MKLRRLTFGSIIYRQMSCQHASKAANGMCLDLAKKNKFMGFKSSEVDGSALSVFLAGWMTSEQQPFCSFCPVFKRCYCWFKAMMKKISLFIYSFILTLSYFGPILFYNDETAV